jgi:hypothetical protein
MSKAPLEDVALKSLQCALNESENMIFRLLPLQRFKYAWIRLKKN